MVCPVDQHGRPGLEDALAVIRVNGMCLVFPLSVATTRAVHGSRADHAYE
jgi:hypothetical protein